MAKVRFARATLQRTLSKEVSGRILLDLVKTGARTPKWTNAYNEHIDNISVNLADLTAGKLNKEVKRYYKEGIEEIQGFLKSGIKPGGTLQLATEGASVDISGWQPLAWDYRMKKPRATRNKFWKNRPNKNLSDLFDSFANVHKAAVSSTKVAVVLNTRGVKRRVQGLGTVYRYDLTFTLPKPHLGQGYLRKVLQESFFTGQAFEGFGHGLQGGLEVIGYLEGTSRTTFNKHRPFLAKVMASKGTAFVKKVGSIVNSRAV